MKINNYNTSKARKIKVQEKINPIFGYIFIIVAISCLIALSIILFKIVSSYDKAIIYLLSFGSTLVLAICYIKKALKTAKNEYLSEMMLTNDKLVLVYKKGAEIRNKEIALDEIQNISAELIANEVIYTFEARPAKYLSCKTNVTILLNNDTKITFNQEPFISFASCPYRFLLDLIDAMRNYNKFSYQVKGNSIVTQKDVSHFEKYGKRLSYWKRQHLYYEMSSSDTKREIKILVLIVIPIIVLLIYLVSNRVIPIIESYIINQYDKTYISYIEKGYEMSRQNRVEESISEYNKALSIHDDDYYLHSLKAYSYEEKKEYKAAIEEVKKAIKYLNNNSIYIKSKKMIQDNRSEVIHLYFRIGKYNMKLKDYKKAIEAFDIIINQDELKDYKHTNDIIFILLFAKTESKYSEVAYFERGKSKYYIGDYSSAMQDFITYKKIIEENMRQKYPHYKRSDLKNLEKWIHATENVKRHMI